MDFSSKSHCQLFAFVRTNSLQTSNFCSITQFYMSRSRAIELIVLRFIDDLRCDFHTLRLYVYHCVFACFAIVCILVQYCYQFSILIKYSSYIHFFSFGRVMGGSYKMNSVGFWGNSTKGFKIWRGGKCSVAVPPVPPTLHVIIS